jgi:hypothetical protein
MMKLTPSQHKLTSITSPHCTLGQRLCSLLWSSQLLVMFHWRGPTHAFSPYPAYAGSI